MKFKAIEFIKRNMRGFFFYPVLEFFWRIPGKCKRKAMLIRAHFTNYFSKSSIFRYDEEMYMASLFPRQVLEKTLSLFKPESILDLGCGIGRSADYFISKGIEVVGIEGSLLAINKAKNPKVILRYNLNNELNLKRKFDLIWSFEFVEHIHPEYLENLLKTFSNHSDRIVMSAARPGIATPWHFNEQPETYWIDNFKKYGYRLNSKFTEELRRIDEEFAINILVFEREPFSENLAKTNAVVVEGI